MEKEGIFPSERRRSEADANSTPPLVTVPPGEDELLRKHQERRHVSFAAATASDEQDPNGTPFSALSSLCHGMPEGNRDIDEFVAIDSKCNNYVGQWRKSDGDGNRDASSLDGRMDLATSMIPGIKKRKRKRKTRPESEDLEAGGKRPSFVASLAPVLRQWSKLATAIGTGSNASAEGPSVDEMGGRDATSEDVFLRRFSTRYLALSSRSRCSVTMEDTGYIAHSERDESEEEELGKFWFIHKWIRSRTVSPDGVFLFYWLSLVTICVLYNWWTLIVRQCFKELITGDVRGTWFVLDTCTDLLFVVELFVQLRTGYLEQGLLVVDAKKLARRYFLSRQFVLDAAALTPLDYFLPTYHPILRFPRLLKTYRPVKFYYMLESRTIYPNAIRVANWCHILLLACHWFACFHFMVAGIGEFKSRWTDWTSESIGNTTLTRKYLLSLYWSTLTLTTIGTTAVPGSEYEYIFTIISYLIGVFVFAAIVGQVGNVITNRNARRLEFERLSDGAKQYMRYHKLPKDMQRRVQQWFDYSWSRGRMAGNADTQALSVLPDKLKTELALRVNLGTLRKVTMFQECQPQFLHDLVLKMRAVIFTPGDIVCRKGEVAREMYIIADGVLEVLNEDGDVLRVMRSGDFFGEIGILNLDSGLNKRSADVRSVGYSELFCLSRDDVLTATKDYPDAEAILREHGQRRLRSTMPRGSRALSISQFSKESPDTESRRQPSAGSVDALPILPSLTMSRFSPARSSSKLHHHRRVERRSHSERPSCDRLAFHFLPNSYRSRSCSVAVPPSTRQAAAPSHVTNLLGCPVVKEEKSQTDLTFPTTFVAATSFHHSSQSMPSMGPLDSFVQNQQQHANSVEVAQIEQQRHSRTGYTCNEEMAALKSIMHGYVCPRVYVDVIHEVHRAQHTINSKFRMLADVLKRIEVEVSALRQENEDLKNGSKKRDQFELYDPDQEHRPTLGYSEDDVTSGHSYVY